MKHIHHLLAIVLLTIMAAGCSSDEPHNPDAKGLITVDLVVEGVPEGEQADLSDYSIAIIPESGFIYSEKWSNITWPLEAMVGKYILAAASPMVSETETTQSWYYGEASCVVTADRTTAVTITLSLKTYPRAD